MVTDEDITAYHAAGWLLGVLLYTPMLGMQKGGHKETPLKLHLTRRTFAYIMIAETSVCFVGRDNLAQRRRALDLHQHPNHLHLHRSFCTKRRSGSKAKLRLDRASSWGQLERSPPGESMADGGYMPSEVPQDEATR
jgi:hypothetical protein